MSGLNPPSSGQHGPALLCPRSATQSCATGPARHYLRAQPARAGARLREIPNVAIRPKRDRVGLAQSPRSERGCRLQIRVDPPPDFLIAANLRTS